jgi:hypothetical protein
VERSENENSRRRGRMEKGLRGISLFSVLKKKYDQFSGSKYISTHSHRPG